MVNNELLRLVTRIVDASDEKVLTLFSLGNCQLSKPQLAALYLGQDDPQYKLLSDSEFASFLNGLILDKRGAKEGVHYLAESKLSNNIIFNKIKIALALKADDVIAVLQLADLNLGKYELSAFFRNVNHKHYRQCSDAVLSHFLTGLTIKFCS